MTNGSARNMPSQPFWGLINHLSKSYSGVAGRLGDIMLDPHGGGRIALLVLRKVVTGV